MRTAAITRATKETDIRLSVNLDGTGKGVIATGVGFFDHMLDLLARHARIDMEIAAKGDLHIDFHHTVEDVGIALGQAVRQALGDMRGVTRYASLHLPMDETLTRVAFAITGGQTLHVETLYGLNAHHIAESCFKGLARALRAAVAIDPAAAGEIPSTKGSLGG